MFNRGIPLLDSSKLEIQRLQVNPTANKRRGISIFYKRVKALRNGPGRAGINVVVEETEGAESRKIVL